MDERKCTVLNRLTGLVFCTTVEGVKEIILATALVVLQTAKKQYRKFEINIPIKEFAIPRKGIAWPQSQIPHSCVCE